MGRRRAPSALRRGDIISTPRGLAIVHRADAEAVVVTFGDRRQYGFFLAECGPARITVTESA